MTYEERGKAYFHEGYNCAQAVLLAFAEPCGLNAEEAARLASSFGGGMGRLREVCGAVSGMLLAAGILYGYSDPTDNAAKRAHYARVQELAKAFQAENGSYICRELLGIKGTSAPTPEARTSEYYQKRPCSELVGCACRILSEYLESHPVPAC